LGITYFKISFTFAATATPSFFSDSAVRCKPSTPEKSRQLPALYEAVAKMGGAEFLNAGAVV
jgi:hypothetical protein